MKLSTVEDCRMIQLPRVYNPAGSITAINNDQDLPFAVKRIYYLYDVPGGEARGGHAHKDLHQLIVAGSGSFDIVLNDSKTIKTFSLSRPYMGLYVPPGLWRELTNFSSGAICLVLASINYLESDYFRNYETFLKYKSD